MVDMAKHSHHLSRPSTDSAVSAWTDNQMKNAVQLYLQKFSDDRLMKVILSRMTDEELAEVFEE